MKKEIQSETKFIWGLMLKIILLPISLIQVLFKKKKPKHLLLPLKETLRFIFEPKFTITIIILNITISLSAFLFLKEQAFFSLMNYPQDLIHFGRFYTLITSGFIHANLLHLFGNMLAIFIFGRVVERKLNFKKTSLIYFGALIISGAGNSFMALLANNNTPGLGASGALMGLVATAMLIDPFYITHELILPLPVMIVGWLTIYADLIGLLSPRESQIGHLAHLIGFLSITIIMFFLSKEDKSKIKKGLTINLISLAVIFLIYLSLF